MGKKKKDSAEGEGAEEGKSGKLKLIIGAVILLVGGAVLGGKMLGGGAPPADASAITTTTTEPPGPVTSLDSITLNLADGRFLKLGLSFEIHHDVVYPPEEEAEESTKGFARELDAVISAMSTYTFQDLVAPNGKAEAKRRLLEEARRVSDDKVKDVLFHEFVMQ